MFLVVFSVLKSGKGMFECVCEYTNVAVSCVHVLPFVLVASDAWLQSYNAKCAQNYESGAVCADAVESLWGRGFC